MDWNLNNRHVAKEIKITNAIFFIFYLLCIFPRQTLTLANSNLSMVNSNISLFMIYYGLKFNSRHVQHARRGTTSHTLTNDF